MSDIPPVSYSASESAPAADAASTNASANGESAASNSNAGGFAVALDNAGPKPVRKAPANKSHEAGASGGQLPVSGNVSPPPTLLVPLPPLLPAVTAVAPTAAPPAAAAIAAAAIDGAGAASTGVSTTAIKGAAAAGQTSDGSSKAATVNPQVWVAPVLGPDSAAAGSVSPPIALADASAETPGDTIAPPLAGPAASTLAGLAAAKVDATAGNLAAGGADKAALPAQLAAATSAATSARSGAAGSANPTAGFASGINDAASQAVSGAAIAAAATGVVAASKTDAADADDLATAATGTVAQAAAAAGGTPVVTVPIAAFRAATPISIAAAVAAAASRTVAQTATSLATNSADKHSPNGSADSLSDGGGLTAAAGQLSVTSTAANDLTATPTLKVSAGVDTPEFGSALSERVSWMLDNNVSSAKLQVNPPQLGPIEVRITLQGDHAQVWLTSHSAVTRDALESSSPKLREMLGAQGFGQVSVDISQRSFQERSTQPQPYEWTPSTARAAASSAQSTSGSLPRSSSNSSVDAYA